MGIDELRALMDRAATLYRNGEILAALADWEHVVSVHPGYEPATRAIAALQVNYDLLDECLLPGGQPLDLTRFEYVEPDDTAATRELRTGIVLASAVADTQPVEFFSEPTAELPGIDALAAVQRANAGTDGGFHDMPTADLPGIASLSAMAKPRTALAEQPGDSDARSRSEWAEPPTDWAGTARLNDSADGARDFAGEETAEVALDSLDDLDLELGDAGAPAPRPTSAIELGTRATEELSLFSGRGDFGIELPDRPRLQPLRPQTKRRGGRADTEPAESESNVAPDFSEDDQPTRHRGAPRLAAAPGALDPMDFNEPDSSGDFEDDQPTNLVRASDSPLQDASLPPLDEIEQAIRAEIERSDPGSESPSDRTRRRVTALLERAEQARTRGDTVRAIIALELAFVDEPDSAITHKLLNLHREAVQATFESYLSDLSARPTLDVPLDRLLYEHIDARAAFLLSRVDGSMTVEELLDVSGMPRIEALRYVSSLVLRGILILAK